MKHQVKRRHSAVFYVVLALIIAPLVFGIFGAGREKSQYNPWSYEIMRDIRILQDLDAGDLKSARQKLNENSMECVFAILETVRFTTNRDTLFTQPGLRAAAKYWGDKELPINDTVISYKVHEALTIVKSELERQQKAGKSKPSEK